MQANLHHLCFFFFGWLRKQIGTIGPIMAQLIAELSAGMRGPCQVPSSEHDPDLEGEHDPTLEGQPLDDDDARTAIRRGLHTRARPRPPCG